jgi:WD40 repeat protein
MKALLFSSVAIWLCGLASCPATGEPIDLRLVRTIRDAHPKGVAALAIFGDSQLLLSVGHSPEVKFWDLKTGLRVRVLSMQTPGRSLAFSPSGKWLAAGGGEFVNGAYRGGITLWNTADWTEVRSMEISDADVDVVLFLDDATLVSGGLGGIRIWDVATGKQTRFIEHPAAVLAMDLSPDKTLLGFGSFTAACYLLSTKDWSVRHTFPPQKGEPRTVSFSKNGALFFCGGAANNMTVWDVQSGKEISTLDLGVPLRACLPVDAQTTIVAGGEPQQAGLIAVVDLREGSVLGKIKAHSDSIHAIAVDPTGRIVATGSADGSIQTWNSGRSLSQRLDQ